MAEIKLNKVKPYDDIINLKRLFSEAKFWSKYANIKWKNQHHKEILEYHKKYNEENNIYERLGGVIHITH